MPSDVNELCVFIASPGDLNDERAVLRSLEADLNSLFAPANIRVRMTGWEERPPAYGRPQGQINPMVDACDVFIGLLRRKWGSHTGTHESGFEEEFERALARRQSSGVSPEISLFFAQLSQDEIDDAGPDLKRVLAFQKRVRTERVGIYSKFGDPAGLGHQVKDLLQRHLMELVVSQGALETPTGPESLPDNHIESTSSQVEDASADVRKDDARSQLSKTLGTLQDILSDREPQAPLDRDRLELIGTALGRDDAGLGAHLVNRLYQRRDDLELIQAEHYAWVRTLMEDIGRSAKVADRVIPGWAIIERNHASFGPMMLRSAMDAGAVGIGALRSMQRLDMRPATLWPPSLRPESSEDDPGDEVRLDHWTNLLNRHKGRSASLNYLLQDLDTQDQAVAHHLDVFLAAIQQERGDLNDESRQLIVHSRAALAGDPSALAEALGYSSEDSAPWRLVLRHIEKLDQKRLNQLAAQNFNHAARMAALHAAIATNSLSDGTLKRLLFEDNPEITTVLLDAAQSDPVVARRALSLLEDKDKLTPTGLEGELHARGTTRHELERLNSEKIFSNAPWEALTHLDPDSMASAARVVLQTNASELRVRLQALIGDEHRVIDFLAEDRKRIAAALLARRGKRTAEDVDLVVQWFEECAASGLVHEYAFAVLANVADESTLEEIIEILHRHRDSTGIRSAYDRIEGPLAPALATLFLNDEVEHFREPSMLWHVAQGGRTEGELREALFDKSAAVRAVAAEVLASCLSRDDVMALLEAYPNSGSSYWYNVVAILDEYLYAPSERFAG